MKRDRYGEDVRAAMGGDRDAFGRLVDAHYTRAFSAAIRTGVSWQEAEDAVQEGFVAAWTHLDSLRAPEAFTMWLMQIVRNVCRTMQRDGNYRKQLRERMTAIETENDVETPRDAASGVERRDMVIASINQLRPSLRETVIHYYMTGRSIRETADLLETTPNAVKKRLQHAREQLRTLIAGEWERDAEDSLSLERQGSHSQRVMSLVALGPVDKEIAAECAAQASSAGVAATQASVGAGWLISAAAIIIGIALGGGYVAMTQNAPNNDIAVADESLAAIESAPLDATDPVETPAPELSERGATVVIANIEGADSGEEVAPEATPEVGEATPETFEIRGQVVDTNDNPVLNAEVIAYLAGEIRNDDDSMDYGVQYEGILARLDTGESTLRTTSGPTGKFTLGLPMGQSWFALAAFADGYHMRYPAKVKPPNEEGGEPQIQASRLSASTREEPEFIIVMDHGSMLRVHVKSASGKDVAHASVRPVVVMNQLSSSTTHNFGGITDEHGYAEFGVEKCELITMIVYSEEFGTQLFEQVPVGLDQAIELQMEDGATIHGTVTWPDKTPAPGVNVVLQGDGEFEFGSESGMYSKAGIGRVAEIIKSTGPEGMYEIAGVWPGFTYEIWLENKSGEQLSEKLPIHIESGRERIRFDYEIQQPVKIFGVIVSTSSGKPLENVSARWYRRDNPDIKGDSATEEDGSFELELRHGPGEYVVYPEYLVPSMPEGFEQIVRIGPDASPIEVTLQMPPPVHRSIRLLDAQGMPIEGAYVSYRTEQFTGFFHGRTDEEGYFEYTGFPPGREAGFNVQVPKHVLEAMGSAAGPTQRITPFIASSPGDVVPTDECTVLPFARITGGYQWDDGEPVAEMRVRGIVYAGGFRYEYSTLTDANGRLSGTRIAPVGVLAITGYVEIPGEEGEEPARAPFQTTLDARQSSDLGMIVVPRPNEKP